MIWPNCQSESDHVVDSRPEGERTRRRRECRQCGHRRNTFEIEQAELAAFKLVGKESEVLDLVKMRLSEAAEHLTGAVQEVAGW